MRRNRRSSKENIFKGNITGGVDFRICGRFCGMKEVGGEEDRLEVVDFFAMRQKTLSVDSRFGLLALSD